MPSPPTNHRSRRTDLPSRPQRRGVRSFLYLIAFLLLFVSPVLAKELKIEKFNAQITVLPDSSVRVTETITAHFIGGPWHGLYRDIPVEYFTPQGMNYSLLVTVSRVTDSSGHNLKYESSRVRH